MVDISNIKICSRCIYDETVNGIYFDENGVCNYCHTMEQFRKDFGTGSSVGEEKLNEIIEQIKRDGIGKKYDCIIGVSGGTDSSYLIVKLIEWGLRPLAVHYDNTWNTAIATENIRKVLSKLKVDLYTHVVDNKEMDDIFLSFMKASVPELDAATDLGLAETMYRVANKYNLKYVIEGHSFVTEGIAPIGIVYFDGKYISAIHKKFGKMPMKTYPLMTFKQFMKWILYKKIKKVRPLWYINYSKEEARAYLEKEFDWKYYGGHHLENRMAAFCHVYWFPKKFDIDLRNLSIAASVRSGSITREEGLKKYFDECPYIEDGLLDYFKNRMNLRDEQLQGYIDKPNKSYKDYPTYKQRFENLRPVFYLLAKANLVPMSFYVKYCFKGKE